VEWVNNYLVGVILGGFELRQFQWRGSMGENILVEVFLHWVKEELEHFILV
jgi:hypothetical protein